MSFVDSFSDLDSAPSLQWCLQNLVMLDRIIAALYYWFHKWFFKLNLQIDVLGTSCEIGHRWMPQNHIYKSALIQVMAWCHQTTSHYLSQCWPRFMSSYGVTRPQWFKIMRPEKLVQENGLVLNREEFFSWTNDDQIPWCHIVSPVAPFTNMV